MSISLLAAAGISAALSALGSLGSSKLSNVSNKSMLNRQFQNDVKMWNMQNEYNLPKNQMQRYQDAGLNPNLIYGEGSASSGNAFSIYEIRIKTSVLITLHLILWQVIFVLHIPHLNIILELTIQHGLIRPIRQRR